MSDSFCKNYHGLFGPGMKTNTTCDAGVNFSDVASNEKGPKSHPCYDRTLKTCKLVNYPTPEEDAAHEAFIKERLIEWGKLHNHETDICIHCRKKVNKLVQVGRCVYASPCNCRLWQGKIPKEWQEHVSK